MDFRKVFNDNVLVEDFDRYRFHYCDALFADIISYTHLDAAKTVLELGEQFTQYMQNKFYSYKNFNIVNADFETYSFLTTNEGGKNNANQE